MTVDNSIRDQLTAAKADRDAARGPIVGGGGGPHDPSMDIRITALETDTRAMRVTLERIDERTAHLATSADIATNTGTISTMSARVDAMGTRLEKVEKAVDETVKIALAKSIGPWQLPAILGACVLLIGALLGGFSWLSHQPWFPH